MSLDVGSFFVPEESDNHNLPGDDEMMAKRELLKKSAQIRAAENEAYAKKEAEKAHKAAAAKEAESSARKAAAAQAEALALAKEAADITASAAHVQRTPEHAASQKAAAAQAPAHKPVHCPMKTAIREYDLESKDPEQIGVPKDLRAGIRRLPQWDIMGEGPIRPTPASGSTHPCQRTMCSLCSQGSNDDVPTHRYPLIKHAPSCPFAPYNEVLAHLRE
jgi:hypothetical protein